jgi:hypothetical protein
MVKIGICGKMNAGKNTVAELLHKEFWHTAEPFEIAFADPIKRMAAIMFPEVDLECWFGSSSLRNTVIPNVVNNNNEPLTCRQVLIDIGTQGRKYNYDHWVNLYDIDVKTRVRDDDTVIALDVRFRNEYDYLRKHNYFLIKLLRDETNTPNELKTNATETNQDQIAIHEFDAVIENNGTIDELRDKIHTLKPQILKHQKTYLNEKQCEHNWVMDGHNAGDSICSKCLVRL